MWRGLVSWLGDVRGKIHTDSESEAPIGEWHCDGQPACSLLVTKYSMR
jgi:hypothetical protein